MLGLIQLLVQTLREYGLNLDVKCIKRQLGWYLRLNQFNLSYWFKYILLNGSLIFLLLISNFKSKKRSDV